MPWKYPSKDTDKPTIRCEYCHKSYISKMRFKYHLMSKHVCPVCPERFMGKLDLADHMTKHSQCEACNEWFETYEKMFKHQAKKHYQCSKCRMFFNSIKESQEHPECTNNRRKYKCDQCDKVYLNKNSLYHHKQKHKDIKLECHICGKVFDCRAPYKRHINFHTKPSYQCVVCKKYFNYADALNYHKKSCGKYYCYRCHQDFTGRDKEDRYNKHIQSHKQDDKIKLVITKKK